MATKREPRLPKDTAPGIARVPTQPFGSKPDSNPPDAAEGDPPSEKEFDPFRFAVTELPTGMRQELIATKLPVVPSEQLFDTKPPNARLSAPVRNSLNGPNSLSVVEPPPSFRLPLRTNRILLLCALVGVALAFTLVLTLKSSDNPVASAPPNQTLPNGHTAPPGSTQAAKHLANSTPAAPVRESPSAAPTLARPERPIEAADRTARPPKELTARTRAPNAPIRGQSAPSPPPTVPEVPATPKKESALGSVLAPPPD